jgi:hypothetical protein
LALASPGIGNKEKFSKVYKLSWYRPMSWSFFFFHLFGNELNLSCNGFLMSFKKIIYFTVFLVFADTLLIKDKSRFVFFN